MSLELDERRLAMLAEMGLPPFFPATALAATQEEIVEVAAALVDDTSRSDAAITIAPPPVVRAPSVQRSEISALDWDELPQAVRTCTACALCEGRRNAVFGAGDSQPDWLIVAEPPDEEEDRAGEPFAAQDTARLVANMLRAVGASTERGAFVTNIVKCRPPGNRNPLPGELAQCEPFLRRQIELLQPKVILAMGRFAVQSLARSDEPLGKLRGRAHDFMGIPVVVSYHPINLLRNPADKAKAWADLCLAQLLIGKG